jgi:aldehyde dehydrogenase (NAD+)
MVGLEPLGLKLINSGASTGSHWWSVAEEGSRLESVNPATGGVIAAINPGSEQDYEQVISSAVCAFEQWRRVPAPQRGELIRAIADKLRENKDYLGTLVTLETGKIKAEGDGEVQEMIDMADFAVGQSRQLYGKTMPSERLMHRLMEQWHPLGPIGVITAFNFPVAVWAWNAFLAVVCGNTVVWKPSPKAPLCAIAVQHLCNEVMDAKGYQGVFNLYITENLERSELMVRDKRLPLISFTGSTAVGRKVSQRVAQRLGKCLLELSGNNAVIVDETADLNKAVPSIVFGAVGTAGQRCTSTRRVFVHQSRYHDLLQRLLSAYRQIQIGDPALEGILLGPVIDAAARDRFVATMQDIAAAGGEILYGGNVLEGPGYFVEPTLIKAHHDWVVVQRETFAPILYVITYHDFEDAIAWQNGVSQGLSSALFTESLARAEQFLSSVGSDCGIANINAGTSGAEIGGSFGGEKDSGGGREAGSDSWKAYMRRQTNTINGGQDLPLAQGIVFSTTV